MLGIKRGFLGFALLAGAAQAAAPLHLRCGTDESDLLVADQHNVTLTYRRDSAPKEIYDLFGVSAIARKAYEQVELSVTIPRAQCDMPEGFSLKVKCDSRRAMKVVLKAASEWDVVNGGTYDYSHEYEGPVVFFTDLWKARNHEVRFLVKLGGQTEWKSTREIFDIEMGKSHRCVVNGIYEVR